MALARFLVNPVRGTVGSITVEYALLEGRFWLPRLRTAEGLAQVSFVRVPFELQQKYEYSGVNGVVDVPEIPLTAAMAREDSIVLRDSLEALPDSSGRERARLITQRLAEQLADSGLARQGAGRDSAGRAVRVTVGEARRRNPCDTAAAVTTYSRSENRTVRIMTTATCNDSLLINSARFPHSIYTSAEELLGATEREELQGMLGLGAQSRFAPQKPVLKYGIGEGMLRYNRVEGLSPAIGVGQLLGAGLSLNGLVRAGTADHEVNGEVGLALSSGTRTLQLNGYRRLVATNDWGNPLGFGASFQAMVFGRDEGFYYRGTGAELLISGAENPTVEWRLFAERQRNAEVEAEFSIANSLGDRVFPPNIVAERGDVFGAGFRMQHSLGVNPDGLRLYTQLKAENAIGDFDFARGLVDATFSTGLFGVAAVGVTFGIGSSMGHVPAQRHFLLGGTHSVRGQRAGTSSGDAFWMTRFELGTGQTGARRVLFADFGWAGSREDWGRQSRALSGVGLGWSFLDGLIRMDIARGIYPGKAWRFTSYVDARF
jgi:hypothetical protein